MTDTVVIALPKFIPEAEKIAAFLGADVKPYTHTVFSESVAGYRRIVAVMAAGIVVRGIAPHLKNKWSDPAVVVVSPNLRFAIALAGGHHGANDLARYIAHGMGMVPVITTATEALGKDAVERVAEMTGTTVVNTESTRSVNAAILNGKSGVYRVKGPGIVIADPGVSFLVRSGEYAVGVGCRKGATRGEVKESIMEALSLARITPEQVFIYATTEKKLHEAGLREAVQDLSGGLIFLDDETINRQKTVSPSAARRLGIQGVAEPCALAVAKRGELVMKKTVMGKVTIAIAR
ncbi:MAG: cobalt-precorrin 5A hydrolase [Methanoregulaceae archaeon]